MLNALKTLLLLALLAITGEAAATHCGSERKHPQGSDAQVAESKLIADHNPHHSKAGAKTGATSAEEPTACSHGQCEKSHSASTPHQNCDGSCNCCPGHCANVIPASAMMAEFVSFSRSHTAYRPLDSTPAPESAIRPPILA